MTETIQKSREYVLKNHYQSEYIRLDELVFEGIPAHRQEQGLSCDFKLVFPRRGLHIRNSGVNTIISDPNQVLLFNRRQRFEFERLTASAELFTVITPTRDVLFEIVSHMDPYIMERQRPFRLEHFPISPALRMELHFLQVAAHQTPDATRLDEMLFDYVMRLFKELYSVMEIPYSIPASGHFREVAVAIQEYLNTHFQQPITLEDIGKAVNYSPFTISRIFKSEVGISIHQYLTHLRLMMAMEYLQAEPQLSLTEIALDLGFSSHSHFTSTFSNKTGLPPAEFRKHLASYQMFMSHQQKMPAP